MLTEEEIRALYEAALKEDVETNYFDTIDIILDSNVNFEDFEYRRACLSGLKDGERSYRSLFYKKDGSDYKCRFQSSKMNTSTVELILSLLKYNIWHTKYELDEYLKTKKES